MRETFKILGAGIVVAFVAASQFMTQWNVIREGAKAEGHPEQRFEVTCHTSDKTRVTFNARAYHVTSESGSYNLFQQKQFSYEGSKPSLQVSKKDCSVQKIYKNAL